MPRGWLCMVRQEYENLNIACFYGSVSVINAKLLTMVHDVPT